MGNNRYFVSRVFCGLRQPVIEIAALHSLSLPMHERKGLAHNIGAVCPALKLLAAPGFVAILPKLFGQLTLSPGSLISTVNHFLYLSPAQHSAATGIWRALAQSGRSVISCSSSFASGPSVSDTISS